MRAKRSEGQEGEWILKVICRHIVGEAKGKSTEKRIKIIMQREK